MLFCKCCLQLLLRMVSPQAVGLILIIQLIGVVLNVQPPPREIQMDSSNVLRPYSQTHPTVRVNNLTTIEILKRKYGYLPFSSERILTLDTSKIDTPTVVIDKKIQYDRPFRTTRTYIGDIVDEYEAIDLPQQNYDGDASSGSLSNDRDNGLEVRGLVYDDLPHLPLNPTFNAKRYRKVKTSAKPSNPGVQYKQAYDISSNEEENEMKSLGSDSGMVRSTDREKEPLQYKRAFRLRNKTHDRKKYRKKLYSSSQPTSTERRWKHSKRMNSELSKYPPPTNSSFKDSLDAFTSGNKNHVPLTITKENVPIFKEKEDGNFFKLLTSNIPDKTHKKSSIANNSPNYTRSESEQNQTTLSTDKDLNSSSAIQGVSQGILVSSINSSEIQINNSKFPDLRNAKTSTHFNGTNNYNRRARKRNLFRSETVNGEHKNETTENTLANKLREASSLFNYSYNISAMDRGSLFPHDPFEDNKDFGKRSLFFSGYTIPNFDLSPNNNTSSRKSSVYETLRPRLRTPPSPTPTSNTWIDKLANLISIRKHQINDSAPQEKAVLNFNRKDDEIVVITSTLIEDESTSLPTPETTTDILSSTTRDLQTETPLKIVETVTSSPSIKISSRKIPDSSDFTGNVPVLETEGMRNSLQISKRQRQYTGIRRPFLPVTTTSRPSVYMFRENKNSVTITPENINLDTTTIQTTLSNMYDAITDDKTSNSSKNLQEPTTMSNDLTSVISETTSQPPESDLNRRPKMTDKTNSENFPFKGPRLDPKTFYDYLMKSSMGNATYNFSLPEFRPGNFYRYDGIYPRKPVLDAAYSRPPPFFKVRTSTKSPVTEVPNIKPTTFESKRTSIRVLSTFYPNRMQDVTMRFGNVPDPPTTVPATHDDDPDEYRDPLEAGFTMEKLAYLLIGTCCGLSVLCLCVVVIAIKCRRHLVEQRLKAHFKSRMKMLHDPRRLKEDLLWQQQLYDPFLYMHGGHPDSSRSSNNSCNCHCVTWSLGARNLETTHPPSSSTNRSSLYLCGQKKLPFGAASTLRFESMLGRKRSVKNDTPADSSPESDSLEHESSDSSEAPRQCTCISYTMWPMPVPGDVRRGMYGMCPTAGHYIAGDCSHHQQDEGHVIPRDCPPPVTGSNYLDRSEGVVYWSSNDERLI